MESKGDSLFSGVSVWGSVGMSDPFPKQGGSSERHP